MRERYAMRVMILFVCILGVTTSSGTAATLRAVQTPGHLYDMASDGSLLLGGGPRVWHRTSGELESVLATYDGAEPDGGGSNGCISSNGRYVAFMSGSSNIVADDPNGAVVDLFIRDLATQSTERLLSVPDAFCYGVSDDGRLVLFVSRVSDLVSDDTNGCEDLFMFDRQTGTVERVNVGSLGQQTTTCASFADAVNMSGDARYVLFPSSDAGLVGGDSDGHYQAFVRDRLVETTTLVSVNSLGQIANDHAGGHAAMSSDGRYVAFSTDATNFLPGASTIYQVYVRDVVEGFTECVSMASSGDPGDGDSYHVAISDDGRHVAFTTVASNLTIDDDGGSDVYLKDRMTGAFTQVSRTTTGERMHVVSLHGPPRVSADGRFVALQSNTFSGWQVFIWDRDGLSDVPQTYWAFMEIASCFDAGIVSGFADGSYVPTGTVDRAQMAAYVSRALAAGDENVPGFTGTPNFPDVDADHWALDYVEYAVAQNVVGGYDDGYYHPEHDVTRDQMAVYVARALVAPAGEKTLATYVPSAPRNFPDVLSDFWSYKHVEYCVENGVVQGYDDGYYHPEYVVTRDQMAVYIARAFGLL